MQAKSKTIQAYWLGIGSAFSLCFSIISAAILSRYFTKEDYGTYRQVMYVYTTLLTVFTIGLPKAYGYFLPKFEIEQGKDVVRKIELCLLIMGGTFSLILLCGASVIADLLNNHSLIIPLRYFSIVPFLMLPTMGIENIMATYQKTHINTIYVLLSRCFVLIFTISPVVFIKNDAKTAIIGFVIASIFECILAFYLKTIPFKHKKKSKSNLKYRTIIDFAYPLMIACLASMLIHSVDQFFISRYFGTEAFAEFSNGSFNLPMIGMIVSSAATILLPAYSRISNDKSLVKTELIPLWNRTLLKTLTLTFPCVIFCWFFAKDIMLFLFGQQYIDSYIYFRIKLVANIFVIVQFSPLLMALGATKQYAKTLWIGAIMVIIFEYLMLVIFNSPYAVIISSVVCEFFRIVMMMHVVLRILKVKLKEMLPLKRLFYIFIVSIVVCWITYILFNYFSVSSNTLVKITLAGVSYYLILFVISPIVNINYFEILSPIINKIKK